MQSKMPTHYVTSQARHGQSLPFHLEYTCDLQHSLSRGFVTCLMHTNIYSVHVHTNPHAATHRGNSEFFGNHKALNMHQLLLQLLSSTYKWIHIMVGKSPKNTSSLVHTIFLVLLYHFLLLSICHCLTLSPSRCQSLSPSRCHSLAQANGGTVFNFLYQWAIWGQLLR